MVSRLLAFLAAVALLYAALVLLLWATQTRLVFPAPRAALPDPAAWGFARGRRVEVRAADGTTLRGWFVAPDALAEGARGPALLWFYGNAETVAFDADAFRALLPPGWALLALDYRGYGASDGAPSEAALYRDAETAWDFLLAQPEVEPARVALYGRSLGSAPALHLAATRPVRAVVLDSPFSSGRELARLHYWFVPPLLVRIELDNLARARRLSAPLLVLHGTADLIAPVAMGRALAAAAPGGRIVELEGVGHNETYGDIGRYRTEMHRFLAEHVTPPGAPTRPHVR
jgi:pimeloyl-ACP methyl ester carboxylesterase